MIVGQTQEREREEEREIGSGIEEERKENKDR